MEVVAKEPNKEEVHPEREETTEALMNEKRLFRPLPELVVNANINPNDYENAVRKGKTDLEGFWEEAAMELDWFRKWDKVLDRSDAPFYKWFVNGKTNIAYNALDRHVKTHRKNKVAIIFESEAGQRTRMTYYDLYRASNMVANALTSLGVRKGDRVAIYLPNIPHIAICMLACAKLGAVHSVVYAGFSAIALRDRVNDAQAKVIITVDGFHRNGKVIKLKEVVDEAMLDCPTVETVIVAKWADIPVDMSDGRYVWYEDLMEGESKSFETVSMDAEDPLFILYTSGTTGKPKGILHTHGGYQVGINRTLKWVFDIKETDIFWCSADPGWITGHSYIVYGPLIAGTTTVMYEGHPLYPTPDRMWQIIAKYGGTILYTAPTTIRMLMRFGAHYPKKYDLSTLRLLGSVGEPINPEAWIWYYENVGNHNCPIMDTWWQTETGMFMITPVPSNVLKPGSAYKPFPGVQADVVDAKGNPVPTGKGGFLVIKEPWPAMARNIYKEPERYKEVYWSKMPGVYLTGDMATKDEDGYFWLQGRSDDVLNIAGHRIGTAEIESALVSHKWVAEAACIGVPDKIRGEIAKIFVILKEGVEEDEDILVNELKAHIRKKMGPLVIVKSISFQDKLPKTRSGKIMRRVLKAEELGLKVGDLSTLDN
ncbi:MAG: acetate--CoA ligase [Deltaproteobacteria bacterium]|nr:acetate--CoA ligase [Deltaproteobacteria bacterium]MBW2019490.1 acetate--CoA ligase [Deltaproteobacteria bacterium]MBW2074327.1 acetate--CoA ligase [Deltaproteobacteria bacterium]